MCRLNAYLLLVCNILGVFGRMPTAYDCDLLRQHGVLTPRCKARYIVNEGKEPLVIDNDEDASLIEFKQRRAPLPLQKRESQLVDSSDCPSDDHDGNWLLNLFSNLYRQFVMCDALKLKQLAKPLSIIDFDTSDAKPQIRRAPARRLPNPKPPSHKSPPTAKLPKLKESQQKLTPKAKKTQLNERYRNVATIKWQDPLNEFHAVEQQKHINQKLKIQPTVLTRSAFHSE